MKRFILLTLLVLVVTLASVSATTIRFSNYGGSLFGPNMFDGYTRMGVSGNGGQATLYNSPQQFYLGTTTRNSAFQVSGTRNYIGSYPNGNYYTPEYSNLQLNTVRYQTRSGNFYTSRDPVTNTFIGSGGVGSYVGGRTVGYAPTNIGYAGGSRLLTVSAVPRTGVHPSTATARISTTTAYR